MTVNKSNILPAVAAATVSFIITVIAAALT